MRPCSLRLWVVLLLAGCGETTGLGVLRPTLKVEPNPIVAVGPAATASSETAFQVRNVGATPLVLSALTIEGSGALEVLPVALPLSIEPGHSEVLKLRFHPLDTALVQATLLINSNDPEQPTARVPVRGQAKTGEVLLICVRTEGTEERCSDGDFGYDVATPTELRMERMIQIRLLNVGTADLGVSSLGLDVSSSATFTFEGPPAPLTLVTTASASAVLRFVPTAEAPATATLVLRVGAETRRVRISAAGVLTGLCVRPRIVDFGRVLPDVASTARLEATACGSKAIEVREVEIIEGGEVFSLARPFAGPVRLTPTPGLGLDLSVVMTPHRIDAFAGKLRVRSDAGEAIIELRGSTSASCALVARPSALDFDADGEELSFDLENVGGAICTIQEIAVDASSDARFSLVAAPSSPSTLPPAGRAEVRVRFDGAVLASAAAGSVGVRYSGSATLAVPLRAPQRGAGNHQCPDGRKGPSWKDSLPEPAAPARPGPTLSPGAPTARATCRGDRGAALSGTANYVSQVAHQSGRWYFEAAISRFSLAGGGIGVFAAPATVGTLGPVFMAATAAAGVTPTSTGAMSILADLDAGRAYFYFDGVYRSEGSLLQLPGVGAFHAGGVNSPGNVVNFNFGAQPFRFEPPPGYQAWLGGPTGPGGACLGDLDLPLTPASIDVNCQAPCAPTSYQAPALNPTALVVLGTYSAGGTEADPGVVVVDIQREEPIALVLNAYEPTLWQIRAAPGVHLVSVSVYGFHRPQLRGLDPGVPLDIHAICSAGSGGACNSSNTGEMFPVVAYQWPFDVGGGDTQAFVDLVETRTCLPLRMFAGDAGATAFQIH